MGKSVEAPEAPDYVGAAEQQADSSRIVTEQQNWANRPTQITPFGRQDTYSTPVWDPTTGEYLNKWLQTTTLNPQSQRALDAQLDQTAGKSELASSMMDRLANDYADPMDWTGFENLQNAPNVQNVEQQDFRNQIGYDQLGELGTSGDYRSAAEAAIYDKGASRLDRRSDQGRSDLVTALRNQGLSQGDASYDRSMRDFDEATTDAYGQLNMDSIIGGGQEASRNFGIDLQQRRQLGSELQNESSFYNQAAQAMLGQDLQIGAQEFGQGLSQSGFNNTVRQQQMAEQMQQRGFTLNEINAIMSGQQVGMPSMPGFVQAQRAESTQYNQAAQSQGEFALDQASIEQAGNQAQMEAITGLAGGAMAMSDRRLKKNIKKIGTRNGLNLYAYNFIWDNITQIGHMADEVKKLFPHAVLQHSSGYDMVNYGALK